MEAEGDAQPRIAEVRRNDRIDAAPRLHLQQVGRHPDHVHERAERNMAEILETEAAQFHAQRHEALIALDIARRQPRHLGPHARRIARNVEQAAVVEPQPVVRVHPPQVDVVFQPLAGEPPELLQQLRHGDDGRTGIEGETVLPVHIRPPARRIEPLQHRHAVAARAQPHRGGKAAKPAADDHGVGGTLHGSPAGGGECGLCYVKHCGRTVSTT